MRYHSTPLACTALVLGVCLGVAGCSRAPSGGTDAPPPSVSVSYPVEREVTDHADFTARTAAVDSVEVRARVWGYLDRVNFKEGALVKKGDVLCEIDPRTYKAMLNSAEGNLASMEARVQRLDLDFDRLSRLRGSGAISREDFDKVVGDRAEAMASRQALKAAVERARLDLDYTRVVAPVSGRVSRHVVTVGNLVQAGETGGTLLTTIVSTDPMYAYFDVDEHTVLRVKQLIRAGKAQTPDDADIPVWLGLANETGHPHRGTVNFIDNQVNPRTGTLKVRGVFTNKDEALSPGYFARVRVPIGAPHKALLVSDRALDTDQGQKILYVVDQDKKVSTRPVRLGAQHDGLREIIEGLQPGERIVVNGLQQIRPGQVVEPRLVEMPSSSGVRGQESGVRKTAP